MKTLYVLRHGEAAPENEVTTDYDRKLTSRGRADVKRVGAAMLERSSVPSLVLASGAARARHSAELCLGGWPAGSELVIVDELYLAGPSAYLTELAARADGHGVAMVVGHNPGLEALVHLLTEHSEHLATASLVELELGISEWGELAQASRGAGRLIHVFRP
jgi:phosphohistidine phosphatase